MNSKKPLITEVNHASIRIPAFLKERLNPDLTRYDLSREADLGVEIIYNFDDTLDFIATDISRVVLDTNRAKNGDFNGNGTFPLFIAARDVERYPDGKKSVYRRGGEPTKKEKTFLLERFYDPPYTKRDTAIKNLNPKLHLSGHSMDSSDDRPNIALINYGDQDGEGDETTASPQFMQEFKTCLEKQFREVGVDVAIEMNTPYDYGHSIRHVKDMFPDLTSLQIELRKDLYLNEKIQEVVPGRAREIKCMVQKAVFDVLKNL